MYPTCQIFYLERNAFQAAYTAHPPRKGPHPVENPGTLRKMQYGHCGKSKKWTLRKTNGHCGKCNMDTAENFPQCEN